MTVTIHRLTFPCWKFYSADNQTEVDIDGESIKACAARNIDWLFQYFRETGHGIGGCVSQAPFVKAWLQSIGVPATNVDIENPEIGHTYNIYFDPDSQKWKAYEGQLVSGSGWDGVRKTPPTTLYIFKPPIRQRNYLDEGRKGSWFPHSNHIIKNLTLKDIKELFGKGVDSNKMEKWMLN